MTDEKKKSARDIVLARRAKFVAAAVAGIGIACGKESQPNPQPCLSVAYPMDDAGPPPQPCLSPVVAHEPDADVAPMPCLSPPPAPPDAGATTEPAPVPCLSMTPPLPSGSAKKKPGGK